jgi:electron transfer flavoprotein beta subunit
MEDRTVAWHPATKPTLQSAPFERWSMKIAVLVKPVPDTYGDRSLDATSGLAERAVGDVVLDEIGERALEVALVHADDHPGTEVIAVAMTPGALADTVRKALAIGAHSAVHIADEELAGADLGLTAEVLAAALRRIGADLVLTGDSSTDGGGGVLPAMLAELLGLPQLSALSEIEIGSSSVRGIRNGDSAVMSVFASLPAVASVTEAAPAARYPTFKNIAAAKRKSFETWTIGDLGVAPRESAGRSIVLSVSERDRRSGGVRIIDTGEAGEQLADFLIAKRLA